MILANGLFYGYFGNGSDEEFVNKVLNETYDHKYKQRVFVNDDWLDSEYNDIKMLEKMGFNREKIREMQKDDFEKTLKDGKYREYFPNMTNLYEKMETLEKEKHRSLYVGFSKTEKKADLSKRINSPFRYNKKKVKDQITYLNDRLLFDALRVLKGLSSLEFKELDDMITPRYLAKLRSSWLSMSKKNRNKLLALMKLPNDKEEW